MYKIIATQEFIDMLKELSIRHLSAITKSFVSIEKCEPEEEQKISFSGSFMEDLMEQLRNQELE